VRALGIDCLALLFRPVSFRSDHQAQAASKQRQANDKKRGFALWD
jgi:hypothetical protein